MDGCIIKEVHNIKINPNLKALDIPTFVWHFATCLANWMYSGDGWAGLAYTVTTIHNTRHFMSPTKKSRPVLYQSLTLYLVTYHTSTQTLLSRDYQSSISPLI